MTESAEARVSECRADGPLGRQWRTQAERAQEAVVPSGQVVVSCSAPLGAGGLGRHFKEVVDALERCEQPTVCICGSLREPEPRARRRKPRIPNPAKLLSRLPTPLSRGLYTRAFMVEFDAYAARRLPAAERAGNDGAGHLAGLDNPVAYNNLVRAFLKRHTTAPL